MQREPISETDGMLLANGLFWAASTETFETVSITTTVCMCSSDALR